jgi:hypothetical protein
MKFKSKKVMALNIGIIAFSLAVVGLAVGQYLISIQIPQKANVQSASLSITISGNTYTSGTPYDWGNPVQGQNYSAPVTVKNTGTKSLTVYFSFSSSNTTDFIESCGLPATFALAASAQLSDTLTLSITSNATLGTLTMPSLLFNAN